MCPFQGASIYSWLHLVVPLPDYQCCTLHPTLLPHNTGYHNHNNGQVQCHQACGVSECKTLTKKLLTKGPSLLPLAPIVITSEHGSFALWSVGLSQILGALSVPHGFEVHLGVHWHPDPDRQPHWLFSARTIYPLQWFAHSMYDSIEPSLHIFWLLDKFLKQDWYVLWGLIYFTQKIRNKEDNTVAHGTILCIWLPSLDHQQGWMKFAKASTPDWVMFSKEMKIHSKSTLRKRFRSWVFEIL